MSEPIAGNPMADEMLSDAAEAMWRAEVEGFPNVLAQRTHEAWNDQDDTLRAEWFKLARTALDIFAARISRPSITADAVAWATDDIIQHLRQGQPATVGPRPDAIFNIPLFTHPAPEGVGEPADGELHDDRCASLKGHPCNCASAAFAPQAGDTEAGDLVERNLLAADIDTLRELAGKLADGIVATPMIHHDNFTRDIPATVKLMAEASAGIIALLDENERLRAGLDDCAALLEVIAEAEGETATAALASVMAEKARALFRAHP